MYDFGYAEFSSEDAYVLSGPYMEDGEEKHAQYSVEEYQAAVDEHKDIILSDGDELVFGQILGINTDYYKSSSCATMYSFDPDTGKYRIVDHVDADGTKHFDASDNGRTVEEMRNAKFNDTWVN